MAEQNLLLGGLCVVVSVILYGTVFVPVKMFEARDGIFVSVMMSLGQLLPCLITSFAYASPVVYPLAMISGVFYAIANAFSIVIMEGLGMAVGYLIWNVITSLSGWAVARFGLFGTTMEVPANNVLNIIGVGVLCLGAIILAFVRSNKIETRKAPYYEQNDLNFRTVGIGHPFFHEIKKTGTPVYNRLIALALAAICGVLYGNMPTPINILVRQHNDGVMGLSPHSGAYMLSCSIGALLGSILIFSGYTIYRRNLPFINVEIAVPSLIAGIIYGTAMSTLFVAMENINQVIVFPICAISPSLVTSLWAILYYKEIKGNLNIATLIVAYLVTATGIILIAVSKNSI